MNATIGWILYSTIGTTKLQLNPHKIKAKQKQNQNKQTKKERKTKKSYYTAYNLIHNKKESQRSMGNYPIQMSILEELNRRLLRKNGRRRRTEANDVVVRSKPPPCTTIRLPNVSVAWSFDIINAHLLSADESMICYGHCFSWDHRSTAVIMCSRANCEI